MGKKFNFTLQPVLDHRKRIEDQKQQTLAMRRRAWEEARRELDRLNDEFRSNSRELRERHNAFDVEELRVRYAHLQFIDRMIDAQIKVLAERQVALDRARKDLVAASKNRKVVDKLKERRKLAYSAEELRVEQIELDDGNARMEGRLQRNAGGMP
jgi:flagellar protein FliJ